MFRPVQVCSSEMSQQMVVQPDRCWLFAVLKAAEISMLPMATEPRASLLLTLFFHLKHINTGQAFSMTPPYRMFLSHRASIATWKKYTVSDLNCGKRSPLCSICFSSHLKPSNNDTEQSSSIGIKHPRDTMQRLTQRHRENRTQAVRGGKKTRFLSLFSPPRLWDYRLETATCHGLAKEEKWGAVDGSASTLGYCFIDSLSVCHLGYNFHKVEAVKKRSNQTDDPERMRETLCSPASRYAPVGLLVQLRFRWSKIRPIVQSHWRNLVSRVWLIFSFHL